MDDASGDAAETIVVPEECNDAWWGCIGVERLH